VAVVAEAFHVLPRQAAEDLWDDPLQLSLRCLQLLHYSRAHAAFKRANKKELEAWQGDPMMQLVEETDFDIAEAEIREGAGRGEE
jgi:hypothetical protein